MASCILKVANVLSPIGEEWRGYRVTIATPNMAGTTAFGGSCPSFTKPFFIAEFGDYESLEALNRAKPRITRTIAKMGFTKVTEVKDDSKPKPSKRLDRMAEQASALSQVELAQLIAQLQAA